MTTRVRGRAWQRVVSFGLVYLGLGVGSAVISNDLESALIQASVRVGILLVAMGVLAWHVRVELVRSAGRRQAALMASGALACGTFLLAAYAVALAWHETAQLPTSLLSALLIWPAATSLPAFLAALVLGSAMVWFRGPARGS